MQVGVLLIAAGTILGGVWADYSWGRFWGWDPKEVWALITLLVYLIPLHGRFAGWVNTFGLVIASVVCFLSVVMAWYGVNFVLGVGLHSYGFVEGGSQGVVSVIIAGVLAVARRPPPGGAAWRIGRCSDRPRLDRLALGLLARRWLDPERRRRGRPAHPGGPGSSGGLVGDRQGPLDPVVEVEPELMRPTLVARRREAAAAARRAWVTTPCALTLADLDAGRRQLDQALEQVGRRPAAAVRVPERFPGLVGLPVVAGVEELDPAADTAASAASRLGLDRRSRRPPARGSRGMSLRRPVRVGPRAARARRRRAATAIVGSNPRPSCRIPSSVPRESRHPLSP